MLCLRNNQKRDCLLPIMVSSQYCLVITSGVFLSSVFSFTGSLYTLKKLGQHFHTFSCKTIIHIQTHGFPTQTITEFLLSTKQSVWHQVKQQIMSVLKSRGGDKHSQPLTILDSLTSQTCIGLSYIQVSHLPNLSKS